MADLKVKVFNDLSVAGLQNSINSFLLEEDIVVENIAYSVARESGRPIEENHYCILLYRRSGK